jgi:hypothetical protein
MLPVMSRWETHKKRHQDVVKLFYDGTHPDVLFPNGQANTIEGKIDECIKEGKLNLTDTTLSIDFFSTKLHPGSRCS